MIFSRAGVRYRVVTGLAGGVYLARWHGLELERRHGMPFWALVA